MSRVFPGYLKAISDLAIPALGLLSAEVLKKLYEFRNNDDGFPF